MNSGWKKRTVVLRWLRKQAFDHRTRTNIFDWLKAIGVVPEDVDRMRVSEVKTLDPKAIDAGYLASVAWEWDSWGPSTPVQFVDALALEVEGASTRINLVLASLLNPPVELDAIAA